jgi:lipopolysaccharide/colanic/teichoic acid biosynthesis glycosyltransferase
VPPGVTGLWQVTGRNSLSFEEMIGLDLDYIERWTLRLDLNILARTIPALILHRGR